MTHRVTGLGERGMNKGVIAAIGIFLISCVGSATAYLLGARSVGNWISVPALVLSGWAAFGHLITLDDDMPGEWSNPQRSRSLWQKSLTQLALKFCVFGGLVWFVTSRQ